MVRQVQSPLANLMSREETIIFTIRYGSAERLSTILHGSPIKEKDSRPTLSTEYDQWSCTHSRLHLWDRFSLSRRYKAVALDQYWEQSRWKERLDGWIYTVQRDPSPESSLRITKKNTRKWADNAILDTRRIRHTTFTSDLLFLAYISACSTSRADAIFLLSAEWPVTKSRTFQQFLVTFRSKGTLQCPPYCLHKLHRSNSLKSIIYYYIRLS